MRTALALIGVLLVASFVYAGDLTNNSYRDGYTLGFQHGQEDMRANAGFEFTHDLSYRNGGDQFKIGYAEGYADGYYQRTGRTFDEDDDHHGELRDNDRYYNNDDSREFERRTVGGGDVLAYSEQDFRGSAKHFVVGRYPVIPDGWDDKIESLQINGNLRVILFDKKNFEGKSVVITQDAPQLHRLSEKAASMIIEPAGY